MENTKVTDFEKVTDFNVLYKAYKRACAGKGSVNSKQKFSIAALDGIYQIKRRIETKSYEVGSYNSFKVYEPKERLVTAGTFVDKIVQHAICDSILHPKLQKEFIQTNYAGQINKGTDYGLDCLKAQMYLAYCKYGYDCWIVKADIKKYFYSIDHEILKDIVQYFVDDKDFYWLVEKFIDSTEGIGIPLGNQISQVFALMYLSGLDHFVTGELGVKYYGRYMDDIYLLVESKEYAKFCLESICQFTESLNIELNGKTQIIPFKNGLKFCGFHTYVTKDGKIIRKLTNEKKRAKRKKYIKMSKLLKNNKISKNDFEQSYNSFRNHISKGNCIKFGFSLDKMIKNIIQ